MTEQLFERTVEDAVNTFGNWAYQYEIIFGIVFFAVFALIGFLLIKSKKKNPGYICLGVGVLILMLDVIKVLLGILG